MLDITVTVILVNKTAELVIVQKLYQLSEYIFVLVHLTVNLIGCKITNSNRRAFKTARKRLYFSDFKERLAHFNGTVVNKSMYCPNCKQEYEGKFCPECGTKLIESPDSTGVNINLGDANAISGGVHVSNTTNIQNTYIQEREKSEKEIEEEKRIQFMNLCDRLLDDGILEEHELIQLENERCRLGLDKKTADSLLESARKSAITFKKELAPKDSITMKIVNQVIQKNDVSQIKAMLPKLEAMVGVYKVDEVLYKYYLLLAALNPDDLIKVYENELSENYWQTYWVFFAYLKAGEVKKAEKSASRLSLYKNYPESNAYLQSAYTSRFEFSSDIANSYLALIDDEPCSQALYSFYESLLFENDSEKAAAKNISSQSCAFYIENIFR